MLVRRLTHKGFTLIELAVGLAIVALVLTQAMPSFSAWVNNAKIRNSAESILNGLQLARAHAVKTNRNAAFVLTDAEPTPANVGAAANASGKNWIIRNHNNGGPWDPDADFVEGRSGQESSNNVNVDDASGNGFFVFSSLGRLTAPGTQIDIFQGAFGVADYEGEREMRIIVSAGGQVLMCDPSQTLAATGNPQFCP